MTNKVPKAAMTRWQKIHDGLEARNKRQVEAITRLLDAQREAMAALFEIADGDLDPGSQRARARRAIDTISAMAPDKGDPEVSGNEDLQED